MSDPFQKSSVAAGNGANSNERAAGVGGGRVDTKAIRARADAAMAAAAGGDQPGMRLANRVRTMRHLFGPRDSRYDSVRALADLADRVELSSQDVPALCNRVEALEAALVLAHAHAGCGDAPGANAGQNCCNICDALAGGE